MICHMGMPLPPASPHDLSYEYLAYPLQVSSISVKSIHAGMQ